MRYEFPEPKVIKQGDERTKTWNTKMYMSCKTYMMEKVITTCVLIVFGAMACGENLQSTRIVRIASTDNSYIKDYGQSLRNP